MTRSITHPQMDILTGKQRIPAVAQIAVAFAVMVTKWDINRRTRRTLSALEPHLLRDIGISPGDAAQEAARPFWKA